MVHCMCQQNVNMTFEKKVVFSGSPDEKHGSREPCDHHCWQSKGRGFRDFFKGGVFLQVPSKVAICSYGVSVKDAGKS